MVDSDLIALVKKEDRAGFKTLYERCIAYVYAIVRRYVPNSSDHQDVIQEIFARLFLSIHTFDAKKGSFKFWLRRLTINECLKHAQRKKPFTANLSLEEAKELKADDKLPLHELSKADIAAYLDQMPDGYRQVFMLSIMDEYTHQEIGDLLDISPETSRSQLSRAKSWLRKHLSNDKLKMLTIGH